MIINEPDMFWLEEQLDIYESGNVNKNIGNLLSFLRHYYLLIIEYNKDGDVLANTVAEIITKAIDDNDLVFLNYVLDNELIDDLTTTKIGVYNSNTNSYIKYVTILDYAILKDKCEVAKMFFDLLDNREKTKFISSLKKNGKYKSKCVISMLKPYLKNIEPGAAETVMGEYNKLPKNVRNYVLGPMLVKKTIRRRGGKRKTRKAPKTRK